jgi:hypothetical protein
MQWRRPDSLYPEPEAQFLAGDARDCPPLSCRANRAIAPLKAYVTRLQRVA